METLKRYEIIGKVRKPRHAPRAQTSRPVTGNIYYFPIMENKTIIYLSIFALQGARAIAVVFSDLYNRYLTST